MSKYDHEEYLDSLLDSLLSDLPESVREEIQSLSKREQILRAELYLVEAMENQSLIDEYDEIILSDEEDP